MKTARGVLGWVMVCSAPLLFVLALRRSVQLMEFFGVTIVLAPAVLLIVGHRLTNNTPLSTDAAIQRRKQRVESGTTTLADIGWLVATAAFTLLSCVGLLQVIGSIRAAEVEGPWFSGFLVEVVQLGLPVSLTLGAWHRTRWGWDSERYDRVNELIEAGAAPVRKTSADVAFKICIGLVVVLFTAVAIQFIRAGTDLSVLFRSRR
jgi:hypothetical protein